MVLRADGGGLAQAPRRPVTGPERIAKLVAGGARRLAGLRYEPATVNGQAGAVIVDGGEKMVGVIAFTVDGHRIRTIELIANPMKLRMT